MEMSSRKGTLIILASYLPIFFRLTYHYEEWYIYALKMTVDTSFISFAWLIASGFRQGIVRRLLNQSLHGKFHNYLGYTAIIGVLVHPIAYIFLWNDWRIIIPFLHPYGLLISLGGVAVVLALFTGFTSYVIRKRYYDLWNGLHYLNYAFFIVLFIHVWQSLPLKSPTGVYYILVFTVTVVLMLYKWMFDLRWLSYKVKIQSITTVAKDTYNVRFPVPIDQIRTWEPGQYMMLAIDRTDDSHPFSVSRIHRDGSAEITFKVFGNFTKKFAQQQPGREVYLAGPYGTASKMVNYSKDDLVLIAGGIGITPFRCIIHYLLEHGTQRHIHLFYCVSDPNYFAFDDEFTELADEHANFHYIKLSGRPTTDPSIIQGYISAKIIADQVGDLKHYSYIICGPDAMLKLANTFLRINHVPRYRIHKEEFSY